MQQIVQMFDMLRDGDSNLIIKRSSAVFNNKMYIIEGHMVHKRVINSY